LKVFAAAKVNLFLHVGARRADGYHELESLAVFANVGDELAFEHADALSLEIDGPFASELGGEKDNLVLRAARALAEYAKRAPNARIRLTKNLPVASGIGGGSADAAATLRGLAQLWDLHIDQSALHAIALSLGADVPVCLSSTPAWMEGIGERVTPVSGLPEFSLVLVNPGVAVSTARMFGALKERTGVGQTLKPQNIHSCEILAEYLRDTRNDLESPACEEAPVIGEVLNALTQSGAALSRMSGSGATCFGLFANKDDTDKAAVAISKENPKWWVVSFHPIYRIERETLHR
jgi:4-diphosphocytidyl-2-C-methyl-D-erythritol kinase